MITVTILKLVLLSILGALSTYTDIKTGLIKNKHLCLFGILGVVLNIWQTALLVRENTFKCLTIILMISFVSLVLYFFHIWAAGDCKLTIVLSLLIPYSLKGRFYTVIRLYAYIFITGIVYVLAESIYHKVKEDNGESIFKAIKEPVLNWFTNASFLLFVNVIVNAVFKELVYKNYIVLFVNIIVVIILMKTKPIKKRLISGIVLILSFIVNYVFELDILTKRTTFRYLLIVVIISFKSFASQYNYQEIQTQTVTSGMILSTGTTLLFFNSKIKGLPSVSRENMTSKLTEDEADSVRKWGKSSKGRETVLIVKKTPFAVFVFIGTLLCSVSEVLNL